MIASSISMAVITSNRHQPAEPEVCLGSPLARLR
jgi:hypothetical protein